jgi:hypothetical protein
MLGVVESFQRQTRKQRPQEWLTGSGESLQGRTRFPLASSAALLALLCLGQGVAFLGKVMLGLTDASLPRNIQGVRLSDEQNLHAPITQQPY